jgi:type I restriction enzyme M protein
MLDTTTKRRIDTARDILVGKVPDPKSQVEQITIALIYKFMDDMDLDAEELGGEPSFFSGEYEKYGWRKIFNPSLGGFEMLSLYSEAILKMAQNPNLPQLFRDIFKNAYLPYRDPETLKSFLKIINDFSYDHSEKLGDAFEYLLSVLGSQGDAGQFRTPRHVIDFMTVLIAPKKNETVLDPACGTAGFLISAYKHIFKENSSNYDKTDPYTFEQNNVKLAEITVNGKHYKGDKLSPDDRSRINQNIKGYDISPDMVRLSLVNLYLHGFTDPHIYEYDTLTSEERWNEFYDVILANPPFMSPKGGIRPHKRFAVQSKRSEVLFVDYMAEHLTPTGKAAIIVPEGIIFQSGTAYKSLRKMLVENNYLVGVISLPAGVFNPYSGVKTSILWLDKTLAKKTDKILFAKIENDGFDLGAQRRPIKENDLPAAFRALQEWKSILAGPPHGEAQSSSGLEAGPPHGEAPQMAPQSSAESPVRTGHGLSPQAAPQEPQQDSSESQILQSIFPNISLIEKEKIAENGEFNLSGERYRETVIINSDFPVIDFEDTFEKVVYPNKIKSRDFKEQGKYPIIDQSENYIAGFWNKVEDVFKLEKPVTIFGDHTRCFKYVDFDFVLGADGVKILQPIARFNPKFYYYLISSIHINNLGYSRHFKELKRKKIPLPPLSVQEEIVAEIESYQKIINGAHQVVENYKPKIDIDPEWELVELGDVCEIKSGGTPSRKEDAYWNGDIPWVGSTVCKDGYVAAAEEYISELGLKSSSAKIFESGTTLIALVGATIGKTGFLTFDCTTNQNIAGLIPKDEGNLDKKYLYFACQSIYENFLRLGEGKFRMATLSFVREQKIALPDIEIQRQIVTQIEKEQALVNANKQLIEIYEQKIKNRIAKVWGE